MGSKTPETHRRDAYGAPGTGAIDIVDGSGAVNSTGIIQDDLGGEDDDDDDDEGAALRTEDGLANDDQKKKKKRKPNKKKKKKTKSSALPSTQTSPPSVELTKLFPKEDYPPGELVDYDGKNDNTQRTIAEEARYMQRLADMDDDFLRDYRKAAEVHRQVRAWTQKHAKPGVSLTEVAHELEDSVRALLGNPAVEPGSPLRSGMGFPAGFCVNNVAAHWTPNAGAKDIVLQQDDVLSVDFGVHVNGRIVDSAFTLSWNPVYDNLLASVKDATNTGLREAGVDARISHISSCIQEAMESYEVELKPGKPIPVKAVRNITGHDILRYKIHGRKQIPFVKTSSKQRMEEGEVFAIETFGSTGRAYLFDDVGVYGYGRNECATAAQVRHPGARSLLKTIDENFGTIVFAKRYLERVGVKNYLLPLKELVRQGIVEQYGPLSDVPGSFVAQFEHTILLRPECKEIVSRGDDY
ncbi:methionine aminopeptidase, type II [Verruconis gallopava]|uniref:Methionine aminopeptidase 2 n=1 Tax=Verruconis gallopava TaxID=253628 RepID=A0A0D2AK83_9PEZI|nr:methionine aminopeptidase, type II [Verruconis gallopava]KIV99383.1 methionine aminopeptidase, type II [Verruconis gallopava]